MARTIQGTEHSMKIIILRNVHGTSRNIDLAGWRGRLLLTSVGVLGTLIFGLVGFGAALVFAGPSDQSVQQVQDLRAQIDRQRARIGGVEADSQRDMDALALQLGRLQAQATRLNALGERLAQVGKLDDDEFNFTEMPALGGADDTISSAPLPMSDGITALRDQFDRQEAELGALENMLLDRRIDSALLPTGWPVAQGYIASGYGVRADPFTGKRTSHLGVDFDVPLGSDVHSVAEGVVTYSGVRSGYGNVVEIDHGNGYMTRYAHNSRNVVEVGARVHIGDVVAKVGSTGRSTGPHCHFEVWRNGRPVNPMAYVRSTRANRG